MIAGNRSVGDFGLAPVWIAHAIEIKHGRPVCHEEGVYVCGDCRHPVDHCTCERREDSSGSHNDAITT